jgi:serine/threonine protein kinase
MLAVGELVGGRYRVTSLLGRGGMADVYQATDEQTGVAVAVKSLHTAAPGGQWSEREIRALSRLDHPAIVRLRDTGTEGATRYLVLDLVDGEPLAATLQRGALPAGVATELVAIVADGVQHAHDCGIVHRDIKPANILLDRSGRPHLADFGIARLMDATATTAAGFVMGTASYLAPEQVRADRVGPPADVYALGLVLLECLTGERAFPGTFNEAAAAHLARDPSIPASVAPWLAAIIRSATARHAPARPSAGRVGAALRTPPAIPDGAVTMPLASAAATAPLAAPAPTRLYPATGSSTDVQAAVPRRRRPPLRRRAVFGAVAVGAVVGVAGALIATEHGSGGQLPVTTVPTTIPTTSAPPPVSTAPVRTAPPTTAAAPAPTALPARPKKGKGHGQDN